MRPSSSINPCKEASGRFRGPPRLSASANDRSGVPAPVPVREPLGPGLPEPAPAERPPVLEPVQVPVPEEQLLGPVRALEPAVVVRAAGLAQVPGLQPSAARPWGPRPCART